MRGRHCLSRAETCPLPTRRLDYHRRVIIHDLLPLGLVDYMAVDALQRRLHEEVIDGGEDGIIIGEFSPTLTAGRHTRPEHVLDAPLPVLPVDRAGSVTWHGPGQLVVYPVVRLAGDPVDTWAWIRSVEAGVLTALHEHWDLPARRVEGRAGAWLVEEGRRDRKICAIGLKVSRGATLHGLALNVRIPDEAFGGIIPCGLDDADVASLHTEGIDTTVREAADLLVPTLVASITPRLDRPVTELRTLTPETIS